ncbi:MAG: DUF3307 domain-containing protein [Chloroflexi bacterium]|nr:MAG: DUF3307 domain-containing protein [Chloroflexota bacterium]
MMTPVDSEIALSFFMRLLLGHFVGDFVLQPYWLVLAKRNGWRGLTIHVGVVTLVTALLVWGTIPNWWVWMIVLFCIHLFIDQFRTFIFVDNSRGKGLLLLFLDQLAHMLSLMFIAWAATGWTPNTLAYLGLADAPGQYRLLAYLTGLAILISTAPVLEVEITVAIWAAQGHETNKTVSIDTEDRVLGSIERILGSALMLTGYVIFAPLVFVPRLAVMIYKGQARADKTAVITKVATSFVTALLVSLILYNVTPPVLPG